MQGTQWQVQVRHLNDIKQFLMPSLTERTLPVELRSLSSSSIYHLAKYRHSAMRTSWPGTYTFKTVGSHRQGVIASIPILGDGLYNYQESRRFHYLLELGDPRPVAAIEVGQVDDADKDEDKKVWVKSLWSLGAGRRQTVFSVPKVNSRFQRNPSLQLGVQPGHGLRGMEAGRTEAQMTPDLQPRSTSLPRSSRSC